MKSIVISVLMLSMSLIFVSCVNEGQPTQNTSDVETNILDKKLKPELIIFEGDLVGNEIVYGCCPNAGPWPAYTMTLSNTFPVEEIRGTYPGNIFRSPFGRNMPWNYKLQFWWGGEEEYFIEVRGGEKTGGNRKERISIWTFTQDSCWIWYPNGDEEIVFVDFVLTLQNLK